MKRASALLALAAIGIFSAFLLGRPKISVAAPSAESQDSNAKADTLEQQIVSKEREGLEALKTGNVERFGNLTADDAVFVDSEGPADKAQVLKNVAGFSLTEYSMENIQYVPISANSGLITYRITEKGVSHDQVFAGHAYVSSLWTRRGDKWLCLFSQETAAR